MVESLNLFMDSARVLGARRVNTLRAFTLLEVLAVVALLGIIASVAVPLFGHDTIANVRAGGFVRRLEMDLAHAKRATISTGDNHLIQFSFAGGKITGYSLVRRNGDSVQTVDGPLETPTGVTVIASQSSCEFDFDGSSLAANAITVLGPSKTWEIAVIPATGSIRTTELSSPL